LAPVRASQFKCFEKLKTINISYFLIFFYYLTIALK